MYGKAIFRPMVVALAVISIGGCRSEKDLVGRWESNGSISFYFREDGILFFKPESDVKYSGPYRLDQSGVMEARLAAMDGRSGNLTLKLKIQFLTADSVRADTIQRDGTSRVLQLTRVDQDRPETADG
jgi:hypothetical protein